IRKIMPAPHLLNERYRKAVVHFLNGMTKGAALREAGFSADTSSNPGVIFNRPEVRAEIERRQHIMSSKAGVDADWIIERLKLIADADLADMLLVNEEGQGKIDLNRLTPALRAALGSFKSEGYGSNVFKMDVKLSDKLKALEMLGRHLGLFQDKLELNAEKTLVELLEAGRERARERNKEDAAT
ncbi:hypothetical protein LCGC14_2957610, partial [marine sediment metagenome]